MHAQKFLTVELDFKSEDVYLFFNSIFNFVRKSNLRFVTTF